MVDSTGTSGYTYDDQGRLKTYTPPAPANRLVEYDYNALGQKTRMTLKNSGTPVMDITYNYYANGWLKSVVKDGTTTIAQYKYDKVGNRTRVDLHNSQGAYTTYAYEPDDPRYLLETIGHYDRSDTEMLSIGYTRDSAGNPLSIGGQEYTYDANNRLDSWVNNTDYNYDWVGNRLNPPASPDMVYNAADQLVTWPGQHTYDYLGTGSLSHEYDSTGLITQKTYSYTPTNLLSSVVHEGIGTSSMTWDADSNRISFTSSTGGTTQFVYATSIGVAAVVEEISSSGSVYYVREPNGTLIARVAGEMISYYHFDGLGSTRLLTSASGAKTDEYTFGAWGQTTAQSGNTNQPYRYVGQFGYYTHCGDGNLPLMQLGVRFYNPSLGRFTQVDPIGDGMNWYAYCSDRPLSTVDPRGLYDEFDFVWHYYHGKGAAVNLADVGLLDDLQCALQFQTGVFGVALQRGARDVAKSACGNGSCKKKTVEFCQEQQMSYNLTTFRNLFSLGRGFLYSAGCCSVTADCSKQSYTYKCQARHRIRDRFEDPLDIGKEAGGKPYDILADWSESYAGGGKF